MNTEYRVGALSALGEGNSKDGLQANKKLARLFEKSGKAHELFREAKFPVPHQSTRFELAPVGTRRKWHENEDDSEDDGKQDPALQKPTISKRKLRRERLKRKLNSDVLPRTIFVGNLPVSTTKKQKFIDAIQELYSFSQMYRKVFKKLIQLFKKFGAIESARIRCAPVADEKMPKRVAAITRQYHPASESIVGYVKFKSTEATSKALTLNGEILDGHHLRVDLAKGSSIPDHQRSIFVGNLPFDVKEESLIGFFEDAGKIESVRIIRDPLTRVGKGFGYVLFEEKGSVELALRVNNALFEGREIRVKRSTRNPKPYLPPKIPANKTGKFNKMLRQKQELKKAKLESHRNSAKLKSGQSESANPGAARDRAKKPTASGRERSKKKLGKHPTRKNNKTVIKTKKHI